MGFSNLPTEKIRTNFPPLDGGVPAVRAFARSAMEAVRAVERCAAAVDRAARLAASARRLFFFGAGTSGRLAVMEATELWPTFRVKAFAEIAGGPKAMLRAVEGAEDSVSLGARAGGKLKRGDLAIGVTASGVTPYVDGALRAAKRRGAATVLVCCNPKTPIRADVVVALSTGAEPLAGSTRLNAGTATKVALNAITTTAMARAGKTWKNRMVDVVATNAKLRDRAKRLVVELGGVSATKSAALLGRTPSAKEAIAAARLGCGVTEARRKLRAAGGSLRALLGT